MIEEDLRIASERNIRTSPATPAAKKRIVIINTLISDKNGPVISDMGKSIIRKYIITDTSPISPEYIEFENVRHKKRFKLYKKTAKVSKTGLYSIFNIGGENSIELIVQTRIGQLRIDKSHVVNIREVEPFVPEIMLNEDTLEEKINQNQF